METNTSPLTLAYTEGKFRPKTFNELKDIITKTHGLDDDEVCSELGLEFTEEVYANAQNKGGLYDTFAEHAYVWSSEVSKWFNIRKIVPTIDAAVISMLVDKQ